MQRPNAWDAYEEAVMAGRGDEVEPPGEDYEMSETFKAWLVERMRHEVMGQALGAVADVHEKRKGRTDEADGNGQAAERVDE